jgi:predicted nucleotidyltransferase
VACGEVGPDSDYDLMLVVPDDTPDERCRGGLIYQALVGLDASAPVDIVVYRQSRFEELAACVVASLPATVVREGKLLYAQ